MSVVFGARLEGADELDPIVSVKVQRFFFASFLSSKLGICSIVTFCPFDSRDGWIHAHIWF